MSRILASRGANRPRRAALAMALLLAVSAAGAAADSPSKVYRWTDAQGVVHYGDQRSANAVAVSPKVPTVDNGGAAAAAAASNTQCEARRKEVEQYRGAGKITETNGLGETREYDEDQRRQLIERAERAMREACRPPTSEK